MIWEAMQGFGALVGMVTAAFVIWERFYRYEPAAFIVAQPLIPGGRQKGAYLRVINRSERPIIVSWPNGIQDNAMRIALSHSTRSIVVSLLEGETALAIDGEKDFLFPILKPPNWGSISDDNTIDITIHWRFVQPQLWKRDREIKVSITKRSWNVIVDEIEDEE
ncbi:hypothetical protein [Neorhizobium sp. T25_13]|uniref:hypothetical protein n=1 Tax=Neorhizobium sp. T25_13 TaxID=2093830 RepID=UPI000CF8B2FA|nr:hypothetical protein [Neorhizobium sp. T25_13]